MEVLPDPMVYPVSSWLSGRRIAFFTGAYNHISDGVALTMNRLVEYVESHGAKALVYAPTTSKPPAIQQHAGTLVSVPSIPFPGRKDYRLTIGLSRKGWSQLEAFEPDIVHIATPDYAGAQALKWARGNGVPVVTSFHTNFAAYLKYFGSYNKFQRMDLLYNTAWKYGSWFYPQCEHIYVPSPSVADELRSKGITNGLRLWGRGVDADRFHPRLRSDTWRLKYGIQPEELLILFVGRLVWEKGLHVFADVIDQLNARGIPHRSMVVGDGPARKIIEERLTDTVFTGFLSGGSLSKAYASGDIFLFPSDTETFGNVTLEAMASGLPAVCADASGSNLLVVDGETGYLVPPNDVDQFTHCVSRLAQNPELRRAMGTEARIRAKTFEWDQVLACMADYYAEIWDTSVRRSTTVNLSGTHVAWHN